MSALFVCGAGTDIGKTYVAASLVRRWRGRGRRAIALKPVASGVEDWPSSGFAGSDTAELLRAQGSPIDAETIARCTPWRFKAALSPDMAAAQEGRTLHLTQVVEWTREAIAAAPGDATVIIEGVGGVMSPVTADATGLDWLAALGCPALLVAGSYLGAVSHALTALQALTARGVTCAAVVVNESLGSPVGLDATARSVARFAGPVRLITVARGGEVQFD